MGTNTAVPQNTDNGPATQPPTSGSTPESIGSRVWERRLHTRVPSRIVEKWDHPKRPSGDKGTSKTWSIYTRECYSALKRKVILTHATTWMRLNDITLTEISQSQSDKYCSAAPSRGPLEKIRRRFLCSEEGRRIYRRLVGRGRGRCVRHTGPPPALRFPVLSPLGTTGGANSECHPVVLRMRNPEGSERLVPGGIAAAAGHGQSSLRPGSGRGAQSVRHLPVNTRQGPPAAHIAASPGNRGLCFLEMLPPDVGSR